MSVLRAPEACARILAAGRMDAILMAPSAFVDAAELLGISDKVTVTPVAGLPNAPVGFYCAQRRIDSADQTKVLSTINSLVKRGEYARLFRKYYAIPHWALENLVPTAADAPAGA
ncbi:MAG: hypothetical protein V4582_13005 [Pseudomonadota bacterium]